MTVKSYNSLFPKPDYTHHRHEAAAGGVAADGIISTMNIRGSIHCRGYKTIEGFVKLTGGTAPTVVLEPLELAKYRIDGTGAITEEFIALTATGALSDGDKFALTVNGARILMRINTVSGAPTKIEVLLTGAEANFVGVGNRRY